MSPCELFDVFIRPLKFKELRIENQNCSCDWRINQKYTGECWFFGLFCGKKDGKTENRLKNSISDVDENTTIRAIGLRRDETMVVWERKAWKSEQESENSRKKVVIFWDVSIILIETENNIFKIC